MAKRQPRTDDFANRAGRRRTILIVEIWQFLRENRKWWLLPIVVVLILLGAFVLIGGSGLAPFIYALF